MSSRIEILRSMLEQDPNNSFARYGIAMELIKQSRLEEAMAEFRALIGHDPNYAAAYFHGGQTLEKLGQLEDARAIYRQGIEVTARTGDAHTRGELEGALSLLG